MDGISDRQIKGQTCRHTEIRRIQIDKRKLLTQNIRYKGVNEWMEEIFGSYRTCAKASDKRTIWPRSYETSSMLNSAEQKVYPTHKC